MRHAARAGRARGRPALASAGHGGGAAPHLHPRHRVVLGVHAPLGKVVCARLRERAVIHALVGAHTAALGQQRLLEGAHRRAHEHLPRITHNTERRQSAAARKESAAARGHTGSTRAAPSQPATARAIGGGWRCVTRNGERAQCTGRRELCGPTQRRAPTAAGGRGGVGAGGHAAGFHLLTERSAGLPSIAAAAGLLALPSPSPKCRTTSLLFSPFFSRHGSPRPGRVASAWRRTYSGRRRIHECALIPHRDPGEPGDPDRLGRAHRPSLAVALDSGGAAAA